MIYSNFKKPCLIVSSLFIVLFATAYGFAQEPLDAHQACTPENRAIMMEKKQNELHQKLQLSSSQEAAWDKFATSMKNDMVKNPPDLSEMSGLSAPDRLDKMIALHSEKLQKMQAHAQVLKSFYSQLTAEQKAVFDTNMQPPSMGEKMHKCHFDGAKPWKGSQTF